MKQYFIGLPETVDGSPLCHTNLEAIHVTKEVASAHWRFLELVFDDNGAVLEANVTVDGKPDIDEGRILVNSNQHAYKPYRTNKTKEFVRDDNGHNYLGGAAPTDFIVPSTAAGYPFQYLGMLSRQDSTFDLEFDLHLVCPIYLTFRQIWVDYTNPMAPQVVDPDPFDDSENYTDFPMKADDKLVFEKIRFSTQSWSNQISAFGGGHTGVPLWIQGTDAKSCPQTGESMQLICQLGDGEPSTDSMDESIIPKKSERNFSLSESLDKAMDEMDFWGTGDLYVFFCKKSRLACYLIQST